MIYVGVFFLTLASDWLWTKWAVYASQHLAFKAALTSGAIVLVGSMTTLAVVNDTWTLIPAVTGGMLGTYLAVTLEKQ